MPKGKAIAEFCMVFRFQMEAKSKFEIKRNLSFEKSSYRMNDKICQTNGRSFEKIQHLSVMVGFEMDAKT